MENVEENVVSLPKNTVLQIRINQEIKTAAEELFARCGLTITDAINVFIQQSLNIGGLPFKIRANEPKVTKEKALEILLERLDEEEAN